MKSRRVGLGRGKGKGYTNLLKTDPLVHSKSRKGIPTFKALTQRRILDRSPYYSSPKPFAKMPKTPKGWGYLPVKMVIIVPSTTNEDQDISKEEFHKRVDETRTFLADNFGGYTDIKVTGGYTSNDKLIKEDGARVISYSSPENFIAKRKELKEFMMTKVRDWKQDTLGFEFEDDLYYFEKST